MFSSTGALLTTIDVRVEGRSVLKSGVRQYSVYGKFSQPFTIICVINSAIQPDKVSILKHLSTMEDLPTTVIRRGLTTSWNTTFPFKRMNEDALDRYTCRALFAVNCPSDVNGSQCHSLIESDVDIRIEMTPSMALSVGSSVYLGEEMSIKCIARYRDEENNLCRVDSGTPVFWTHVFVSNDQNNVTCTWTTLLDETINECHTTHLKLLIFSDLELSVTPSNFSSNAPQMQFKCTSVPPRLMTWTIITAGGDILDFKSLDDVIKVSMDVTIQQRPGETILNISEASPGGNEVQTVMCSSYDTTARVIVTSPRVDIDTVSDWDVIPKSTAQTTSLHHHGTTTTECNSDTKTNPQNNVAIISHFEDETQVQQFLPPKQPTYVTLVAVVIIILACVIVVLIVYVVILYRRIPKSSAATDVSPSTLDAGANPTGESIRETTSLHDNPVYLSYSEETVDQIGLHQSDSCTYMNI